MLNKVMDYDEKILWTGKPNFLLYVVGNPLFYVVAILWGLFDYHFIKSISGFGGIGFISNYYILFFAFHLLPVWIAIIGPIFRAVIHHKIEYAITNKRIYLVSGFFGNSITSIEFKEINNLSINVNLAERILGVGTIRLTPDVSSGFDENRRYRYGYRFKHINEPYEVYNTIKKAVAELQNNKF